MVVLSLLIMSYILLLKPIISNAFTTPFVRQYSKKRSALSLASSSSAVFRMTGFSTPSIGERVYALNGSDSSSRLFATKSSSSSSLSSPTAPTASSSFRLSDTEIFMHKEAREILKSAIDAVNPQNAIQRHLNLSSENKLHVSSSSSSSKEELEYDLNEYDDIVLIAFGKASADMTLATCDILSSSQKEEQEEKIKRGIVIIKDDHATQNDIDILKSKYNIDTYEASHPIPDERSVMATNKILELLEDVNNSTDTITTTTTTRKTLVICCISGGGSSLFCAPIPPLTLDDLQQTNNALLGSGMSIQNMNIIRKRLELVKGGNLAIKACASGRNTDLLTLVLSDVIGDPLEYIASGPTVPDSDGDDTTGWTDVYNLMKKYNLEQNLPKSVLEIILDGYSGKIQDTLPKADNPAFLKSETVLIGNNELAVMAAAQKAQECFGYENTIVLGTTIEGEAQDIAGMYVSMAQQFSSSTSASSSSSASTRYTPSLPICLIAGGETTVTLPSSSHTGLGGRNQEIGLKAALQLSSLKLRNVVLGSIGTDGTDGPTDAAGAIVDWNTIERVESFWKTEKEGDGTTKKNKKTTTGIEALTKHDAYTFFDISSSSISKDEQDEAVSPSSLCTLCRPLIKTGPTGTNVADVCVVLIR